MVLKKENPHFCSLNLLFILVYTLFQNFLHFLPFSMSIVICIKPVINTENSVYYKFAVSYISNEYVFLTLILKMISIVVHHLVPIKETFRNIFL